MLCGGDVARCNFMWECQCDVAMVDIHQRSLVDAIALCAKLQVIV